MRGVSDMKKVVGALKLVRFYLIGYVIFTTIISLIEVFFLWKLSGGVFNLSSIITRNICNNWITYTIVFLVILAFNFLYNYVSVKRLNDRLKKMKKG